jgi:hypothetical protein
MGGLEGGPFQMQVPGVERGKGTGAKGRTGTGGGKGTGAEGHAGTGEGKGTGAKGRAGFFFFFFFFESEFISRTCT